MMIASICEILTEITEEVTRKVLRQEIFQAYKGRIVLRGNNIRDQDGTAAVFAAFPGARRALAGLFALNHLLCAFLFLTDALTD